MARWHYEHLSNRGEPLAVNATAVSAAQRFSLVRLVHRVLLSVCHKWSPAEPELSASAREGRMNIPHRAGFLFFIQNTLPQHRSYLPPLYYPSSRRDRDAASRYRARTSPVSSVPRAYPILRAILTSLQIFFFHLFFFAPKPFLICDRSCIFHTIVSQQCSRKSALIDNVS